ncbi:MAG: hypothetical protein ABWX90_03110 [Candidatus Saccharimonadales bacterium]
MPNSATKKTSEKNHSTRGGWKSRLRMVAVDVLVGAACLGLGIFVVVHWVERQIFTTDNWVALVSPLPKQPIVSDALGSYISDQVFSSVSVEQKIADALPPQAAFLAAPLSAQLKTITTNSARKLVASDAFQTIWSGANRLAMNRLVSTARGQEPLIQSTINQKFNINISDSLGGLRQALGRASEAIPALQPAADKAVDISTDLKARPHQLRQAVRTADALAVLLPLLIAACLLAALALSSHRRHTALLFAITTIILMLVELISIKWLRQGAIDQVRDPAYISAVGYIYDSLVAWLRQMIYWIIAGATIFVGGLLLGGPASWAVSARKLVRLDRVNASRFMVKWREARSWTGRWKGYLWLGIVVLILIGLVAFTSINNQSVINAALLAISLCALIQIIASPPVKGSPIKEQNQTT